MNIGREHDDFYSYSLFNFIFTAYLIMTDTEKLQRLDFLSSLPYSRHTSEDWDEELALECQLQDHPNYKSFLDQ